MAIVKKMSKRGFTLIELMIVVVIIGVLAALAIYGVQKYVANSKSAEARMMLGRMSKDHLAFFEGENQQYEILAPGSSAGISRSLCPPAAVTSTAVPGGEKFQPSAATFKDNMGWECMNFSISTPIYYQYSMESPNQSGTLDGATPMVAAADTHAFTAVAIGDLDNDTATSRFELGGAVNDDGAGNLALILATTVNELDPEE